MRQQCGQEVHRAKEKCSGWWAALLLRQAHAPPSVGGAQQLHKVLIKQLALDDLAGAGRHAGSGVRDGTAGARCAGGHTQKHTQAQRNQSARPHSHTHTLHTRWPPPPGPSRGTGSSARSRSTGRTRWRYRRGEGVGVGVWWWQVGDAGPPRGSGQAADTQDGAAPSPPLHRILGQPAATPHHRPHCRSPHVVRSSSAASGVCGCTSSIKVVPVSVWKLCRSKVSACISCGCATGGARGEGRSQGISHPHTRTSSPTLTRPTRPHLDAAAAGHRRQLRRDAANAKPARGGRHGRWSWQRHTPPSAAAAAAAQATGARGPGRHPAPTSCWPGAACR